MRVLLTGANGQLGRELEGSCPDDVELSAYDQDRLDITQESQIRRAIDAGRPQLIINAAAYTAVDRAEEQRALAFAVNTRGPQNLARAAAEIGARLIHVSTDFVFSGDQDRPYRPDSNPEPMGVYGESKLAGEEHVLQICGLSGVVVRTAWVYSRFGNNFVKTMLRLMSQRQQVSVVRDQIGTPTWAQSLADVLWAFRSRPDLHGIYHWTDGGEASWFDFAVAIQEEAVQLEMLDFRTQVLAVSSEDFPTVARRPAYSVLDTSKTCEGLTLESVPWRHQLRTMLAEMREYGEG